MKKFIIPAFITAVLVCAAAVVTITVRGIKYAEKTI